jgi:hypothetical protein
VSLSTLGLGLSLMSAAALGAAPVPADPTRALDCTLSVEPAPRADGGWQLHVRVHNCGDRDLRLLRWGTPFEGAWLSPLLQIERDGQPLDYQGPQVKRGSPQARDHWRLAAGRSAQATLALDPAWMVTAPGRYRVAARWLWQGQVATSARAWQPFPPADAHCPPFEFTRP